VNDYLVKIYVLKKLPHATKSATLTASMIFFFSGLSARKKYPSITVDNIEKKPRSVDVMSPNFDISVNHISALIAHKKDAISLGIKKSFLISFMKIS
jgi:hypothetical protein